VSTFKNNLIVVISIGILTLGIESANGAQKMDHLIGIGLGLASPDFALASNPAALADLTSPMLSSNYFLNEKNIEGVTAFPLGPVTIGASYAKDFELGQTLNVGAAVDLGAFKVGASVQRLLATSPLQFDAAFTYQHSEWRFTLVGRHWESAVTELDFGAAYLMGSKVFALDLIKPAPLFGGSLTVDPNVGLLSELFEIAAGYAWQIGSTFDSGVFHLDFAAKLSRKLTLQAFYNPLTLQTQPGSIALGAKVLF